MVMSLDVMKEVWGLRREPRTASYRLYQMVRPRGP